MFDDPRKKLRWMEKELFAAEYGAEEEADYDDILPDEEVYREFGQALARDCEYDDDKLMDIVDDLIYEDLEDEEDYEEEPEPPVRNFANNYGRSRRNPAVDYHRTVYADEEFDESTAVLVERKKGKREKQKKNTHIRGLVFLAFLESLGILAILGWWMLWLL